MWAPASASHNFLVCVCVACAHVTLCMWKSGDNRKDSVLSFPKPGHQVCTVSIFKPSESSCWPSAHLAQTTFLIMSGPGPVGVFCGFWHTSDACKHLSGARTESQDIIHAKQEFCPRLWPPFVLCVLGGDLWIPIILLMLIADASSDSRLHRCVSAPSTSCRHLTP